MSDLNELRLGEGNATKVSVSFPEGTAAAIRRRVGSRDFSRYVVAAVERDLRRQAMVELVAESEQEHGPIPEESKDRVQALLREAERRSEEWPVKRSA